MKKIIYILSVFMTIAIIFVYQNRKNSNSWMYLGQKPPGKTARLFAPKIIKHLAHSSPTFTPDGKEIYWSIVNKGNETRKIYFVKYENNKWSKPKVASFSGNYHDDQPFVSYDGNTLYFASKRPNTSNGNEKLAIWTAYNTGHGWDEPKPIDNFTGFWTPSVTKEGAIYFIDIAPGFKRNIGIFRARLENCKYLPSEFVRGEINQKKSLDWCPFISSDESYLIFSSDREGGFGSGDLYISFKSDNGEWEKPINMGPSVNTSEQERFPGVSPDGKYLFFTRWYSEPYFHDLYWIDAKIIEELKGKV